MTCMGRRDYWYLYFHAEIPGRASQTPQDPRMETGMGLLIELLGDVEFFHVFLFAESGDGVLSEVADVFGRLLVFGEEFFDLLDVVAGDRVVHFSEVAVDDVRHLVDLSGTLLEFGTDVLVGGDESGDGDLVGLVAEELLDEDFVEEIVRHSGVVNGLGIFIVSLRTSEIVEMQIRNGYPREFEPNAVEAVGPIASEISFRSRIFPKPVVFESSNYRRFRNAS